MSTQTQLLRDSLSGEILSSERMYGYMALGTGLGAGLVHIPEDPSVVWSQLAWNYPFAWYVYNDIEKKDDEVSSDLETRKEAVLAKSRVVLPASDKRQDKKLADFIAETLEGYMGGGDGLRFGFTNFLWEAMDAIAKGVAIGENIFAAANDRVYIQEVKFKPQALFDFSDGPLAAYSSYGMPQTGPLRLSSTIGITLEGVDPKEPLPQQKFFVHTFRPYQGNRWGSPLLYSGVFWLSWFKRAGVKQWLRYLERGAGTVLTKYDVGNEADKDLAIQAAQAISEESAVAVNKRFEVEVLENVRQALGTAHKDLTDEYCNKGIARVILGQSASRGGEGGWSKGNVQERVASRKTEVDSLSLMLAVNTQLVWPLVLLNQGPVERPPIWTINYEPGGDLAEISEWLHTLWQMHVKVPVKWVYKTFQLPEPAEGEEVLPEPAQAEETAAPAGGGDGDTAFAEDDGDPLKKKYAARLLKPPTSKTERFKRLRPFMTQS